MPYFLILLIPLLIFLPIGTAIVYHLRKYGLAGDSSKKLANIFIIVSLAIIILAVIAYLRIDWAKFDNYTLTIFNN